MDSVNTHSVSHYSWISDKTTCLARSQSPETEMYIHVFKKKKGERDLEIECSEFEDFEADQEKDMTTDRSTR